jgi:hypothetical protein
VSGYSETPLYKKLGIKPEFECLFINPPSNYFSLLESKPTSSDMSDGLDFIQIFSKDFNELAEVLNSNKPKLKKNGMIWISWPKKASKIPTDITEDLIRNYAIEIGLVDVKVCAVDEIWSGLKLVYRLRDR